MAVVVVPMLLPRVRGYILSILITPSPTSGVSVEVKTLLLCRRNVNTTPITMNTYLVRVISYHSNKTYLVRDIMVTIATKHIW